MQPLHDGCQSRMLGNILSLIVHFHLLCQSTARHGGEECQIGPNHLMFIYIFWFQIGYKPFDTHNIMTSIWPRTRIDCLLEHKIVQEMTHTWRVSKNDIYLNTRVSTIICQRRVSTLISPTWFTAHAPNSWKHTENRHAQYSSSKYISSKRHIWSGTGNYNACHENYDHNNIG